MVDEIEQKIKQVTLKNEDLKLSPEYTRELFTSNKFQRTLALLEGWAEDRVKFLRCTKAGVLKTAPVASGIEEYNVETGTAEDTYAVADTFTYSAPYGRWDILVETYDCEISFRNKTNSDWADEIILTKGWHSIDLVSYGIRVQNRENGENSLYQIIGYR